MYYGIELSKNKVRAFGWDDAVDKNGKDIFKLYEFTWKAKKQTIKKLKMPEEIEDIKKCGWIDDMIRGKDGNLYISGRGKLYSVNNDGELLKKWTLDKLFTKERKKAKKKYKNNGILVYDKVYQSDKENIILAVENCYLEPYFVAILNLKDDEVTKTYYTKNDIRKVVGKKAYGFTKDNKYLIVTNVLTGKTLRKVKLPTPQSAYINEIDVKGKYIYIVTDCCKDKSKNGVYRIKNKKKKWTKIMDLNSKHYKKDKYGQNYFIDGMAVKNGKKLYLMYGQHDCVPRLYRYTK